jgi:hypothetical protein
VQRLCKRHPNERLSAFQALNHPWFQSDTCDFFRVPPPTVVISTYMPSPSCRYASRVGQAGSVCSCPMLEKFGVCAFSHPPEDLIPGLRIAAISGEPQIKPPELWIAQLSSPSAILHEKPVNKQRVRLLRHNCEGEIGWSYVQVIDGDDAVCREGLVASCCVGLPQDATAEWQPPTYDVDTHKHLSVFKQVSRLAIHSFVVSTQAFLPPHQWQPADFKSVMRRGRDGSSQLGTVWEGRESTPLLENISNNPRLAEGVIGMLCGPHQQDRLV